MSVSQKYTLIEAALLDRFASLAITMDSILGKPEHQIEGVEPADDIPVIATTKVTLPSPAAIPLSLSLRR